MLFLSLSVFQGSHGTQVNVTDQEGKLCLFANLTVNFAVLYEVKADKVSFSS